ncbi:MAG: hypothetical protein ABI778_03045 [Ignavibacteriota bacterium]
MQSPLILTIFLLFIALADSAALGQSSVPSGIRLVGITWLSSNIDSLTRSFTKKGYTISPGRREPGGDFSNIIGISDGSEIMLRSTMSRDSEDWEVMALKRFGNHIAGIVFEVDSLDVFHNSLVTGNIAVTAETSSPDGVRSFALDSCSPLDVVFMQKDSAASSLAAIPDSMRIHRNHVYRFDWVLLSAAEKIELQLRKIFEIIGARKLHQGCCDYWRIGPSDDFCFFRFEPPSKKAAGISNWLSIEPENIYFAY